MEKIRLLGVVFLFLGVMALYSNFSINGAVIGYSLKNNIFGFVSLVFLISGIILIFTGGIENKVISSKVKKDPCLLRIAEEVTENEAVKRDINHLIHELNKGNTNPGIGTKKLRGVSDIYELRGRNEGRVYYREINKGKYEILGYSDKKSQKRAIDRLKEIYD